ncbi:hypothetical protein FTX61_22900 [Nitriliruptoraceae bacterium ZYF776]|nr:hypothetical protein [Profundirhabdus halotolerans]
MKWVPPAHLELMEKMAQWVRKVPVGAMVLMEFLVGRVCAVVLVLVEVMDRPDRMVLPVMMGQWVLVDLMEPWELLVSGGLPELKELPVKRVQRAQLDLLALSVFAALQEVLARMAIRVLWVILVLMVQRDLPVLLVLLEMMVHRVLKASQVKLVALVHRVVKALLASPGHKESQA